MTTKHTARRPGDIHTWDGQADPWHGRYELVEKVPGERSTWIARNLPDTPEILAEIRGYYATAEHPYLSPVRDPVTRKITGTVSREQMCEDEIASRAARDGDTFTIKFISRKQYDEYF